MCVFARFACALFVLGACAIERHGLGEPAMLDGAAFDAGEAPSFDGGHGRGDGSSGRDGRAEGSHDAGPRPVGLDGGVDGGAPSPPDSGPPPWACNADDADLVVCLDFEGSLADGSSRENHAEGSGYTFADGPEGRAVVLGADSTMRIAHSPSLELDRFTFSVRISLDALPETGRIAVFDKPGYSIFVFPGGDFWCSGGGTIRAHGSGAIAANAWAHIACVYDGETMRALVDGVEVDRAETTGSVSTTADPLHLGEDSPSAGDQLIGALDSLRIWSRALPDEELPRGTRTRSRTR